MDPKDIKRLNPKVSEDASDTVGGGGASRDVLSEAQLDSIVEVHTRVLDTMAGFGKIAERAEPEFVDVATAFLSMHKRHDWVLADYLAQSGHNARKDGSIFGTVNRGLIEARSWFDRVDNTMIDAIVQGEKHVLEAYEQALDTAPAGEAFTMLTHQMNDIDEMLRKHAT